MGVDKPVAEKKKVKKVKKVVKKGENGSKTTKEVKNGENSVADATNGVVNEEAPQNGVENSVNITLRLEKRKRNLPPVTEEKTVESHQPERRELKEKAVGSCCLLVYVGCKNLTSTRTLLSSKNNTNRKRLILSLA